MSQPNPQVLAALDHIRTIATQGAADSKKAAQQAGTIASLTATLAQVRDDAAATHAAMAAAEAARDKALADLAAVTADRDATAAAIADLDASLTTA